MVIPPPAFSDPPTHVRYEFTPLDGEPFEIVTAVYENIDDERVTHETTPLRIRHRFEWPNGTVTYWNDEGPTSVKRPR